MFARTLRGIFLALFFSAIFLLGCVGSAYSAESEKEDFLKGVFNTASGEDIDSNLKFCPECGKPITVNKIMCKKNEYYFLYYIKVVMEVTTNMESTSVDVKTDQGIIHDKEGKKIRYMKILNHNLNQTLSLPLNTSDIFDLLTN